MALNQFMHSRNRYKDNKPDFNKLAEKYPEFAKHVSVSLTGNTSLDFHDPQSLRALTCTLLKEDFSLDVELPLDRLIPTVPLRLNYIHWIEDLLQQNGNASDVCGIDIGCGASCIYPLLGTRLNGWHFAASEVDELAFQYACENVKRNNLQDHIKVLPAPKDTLIQGVYKSAPQPTYHFTMCNPPFFGNLMEAQGIMSRTMDRPEPKSVSTASEVEMIYEGGGEVDFVKRMIVESLQLREQIVWYTSMLGKKSSLGPLKEELRKYKIRNFTTTEFCQGRTMRWGLAWTFYDDIKVLPPSKRPKTKQRPPLVMSIPGHLVAKLVANSASSSVGHREKVLAVAETTKQMLKDLKISFAVQPSSRKVVRLECTANTNTWANQRRKRRQRQRRKITGQDKDIVVQDTVPTEKVCASKAGSGDGTQHMNSMLGREIEKQDMSPGHSEQGELQTAILNTSTKSTPDSGARCELDSDVKSTPNSGAKTDPIIDAKSDHDSGKISRLDLNTTCNSSVCETIQADPVDQDADLRSSDGNSFKSDQSCKAQESTSVSLTPENNMKQDESMELETQQKGTETVSTDCEPDTMQELQNVHEKQNKQLLQHLPSTVDQSKPAFSTAICSKQGQNDSVSSTISLVLVDSNAGAQTSSLGTTDNLEVEPLFKCTLIVKIADDNMTIEMTFLDGSSREAMHQVGQYIKNQLAK